jgi:DNA-binding LacI/PurR family transcriptional regulator
VAVSMNDVARHAGVSQRTVSNVVNGSVNVSDAMRARVERSLSTLGYRPNAAARRLRSGRTGTITLALPGLTERYFADLAEAIISHARASQLDVLIETTGGNHDRELDLIRGGSGLLTDGLIMSAISIGPDDEKEIRATYPLVLVGDREFGGSVDHVGIPNKKAARSAVTHLIDSGRRRVALLGVGHQFYSYTLRLRGYESALAHAGIALDRDLLIPCEWNREDADAAVERFLRSGVELPDGLFAMNDSAAFGALRAFYRNGIRVPDDIAVVGFDDVIESRFATPSLSSIAPSLDEIASNALEILQDQFATESGSRVPEHRHVGFELRVRESSAPAGASRPR